MLYFRASSFDFEIQLQLGILKEHAESHPSNNLTDWNEKMISNCKSGKADFVLFSHKSF